MDPVVILGSAQIVLAIVVLLFAFGGRHDDETVALSRYGVDERRTRLRSSTTERTLSPFVEAVIERIKQVLPTERVKALEAKIASAGLADKWTVDRLISAKLLVAVAAFLLFAARFAVSPSVGAVILMVAATVVGYFVPNVLLDRRRGERQEQIRANIADSIDQLNVMVRAGLGIDAALARLAQQGHGPVSEEFGRVIQDIRFGLSRTVAFQNMADRVDVPELTSFTTSLAQAERLGIPISQTLLIQSTEMRDRRRQLAEERAMKLPVKLLFPMAFFILPVLFIVLLGPAALRVVNNF